MPARPFQQPKYRDVYAQMRDAILTEQLRPGDRVPSSRAVALQVGVARATVEQAFDQLVLEGLLVRATGRGSFVAERIPSLPRSARPLPVSTSVAPTVSRRGAVMLAASEVFGEDAPRGFAPCVPGRDTFPMHTWNKLASATARAHGRDLARGGDIGGLPALREAIVAHLGATRGVRCEPEHVVVLSSTQAALDLAARLLLDVGDAAWLENPGYLGARSALLAAGARLVPVGVDGHGLLVDEGVRAAPNARLAFVTPSHQYPLGVTLSSARRAALLSWARKANAWVFEDDYDSEFRYDGRPLAALQGLDPERVLYAGSFNKVLFPGVRLAYLVVPPRLLDAVLAARRVVDGPPPALPQATLAAFMAAGAFWSHLHRLRGLYRERRDALVEASVDLPEDVTLDAPAAGMHATVLLRATADDVRTSREASRRDLDVPPLSRYYLTSPKARGLIVGFGAVTPTRIAAGMKDLADVLRSAQRF